MQVGPLYLPPTGLLLLASLALALALGGRLARRRDAQDFSPTLFMAFVCSALVARGAFVAQHLAAYLDAPWDVVDLRDGGFDALAGAAAAWLYALVQGRRHPPLRAPLVVALASASLLAAAGLLFLSIAPGAGPRLERLELADVEGRAFDFRALSGRPVVVNLWASWCPPCVHELPALLRAQREHPEVRFVFIDEGEPAQRVREAAAHESWDFETLLLDPRSSAGAFFDSRALPTTLFYDARGRRVSMRVGALSRASLDERLSALAPAAAGQR